MSRHQGPGDAACNTRGWWVGTCECGRVTLRLGQVGLELSRDEFSQLHRLITRAMTELDIAATAAHHVPTPDTAH